MGAADRPKRDRNKKPKARTPEAPPPRKTGGSWTAAKIFHKNSPVVNSDIQAFLLTCFSDWDKYALEDQRAIIDVLPPSKHALNINPHTGKLECPLDSGFIAGDPYLKRGIKRFQRDIDDGHYTQSWQKQARQAMKERAEGRFDEYIKQHTEEMFGDVLDEEGATPTQFSNHNDETSSSEDDWNSSSARTHKKLRRISTPSPV